MGFFDSLLNSVDLANPVSQSVSFMKWGFIALIIIIVLVVIWTNVMRFTPRKQYFLPTLVNRLVKY